MPVASFIKNNPLVRLVLPLMGGIIIGWCCSVALSHQLLLCVLSATVTLAGLFSFVPSRLFGVGVSLFMLSVGIVVEECQERAKAPEWGGGKGLYKACLIEEPEVRGMTVKVLADVRSCAVDGAGRKGAGRDSGLVCVYFKRSVDSEQLRIGLEVLLEAYIKPFMNAGNPAEFDAERFYYIKGVTGTAYVADGDWSIVGDAEPTLQTLALKTRGAVVDMYRALSFEGDNLALLSALTVGERRGFPQELNESYSAAGASHILALSGMHLGVFYMLLVTLLPLWSRRWVVLFARETLVVAVLWAFAFVAGLSPSIVRAAVLFTLISVGRLLQRDSSPVNSLAFAAIVMLIFSPHQLFDVSFQLSFAAVLSILLLAPSMQRLLRVNDFGAAYRYIMNLVILSLAAQVGTVPFVWYYFGLFPLYFILTNIVIVPLAFVLVSLAPLLWTLVPLPMLQQVAAVPVRLVVGFMNDCVSAIADLPGATLQLPPIDVWNACAIAVILALLAYSFIQRCWWLLFVPLSSVAAAMLIGLFLTSEGGDDKYLLFYNNKKNPLLHAVAGEANYLVSTVPQLDAEYEYASAPFVKREGLAVPRWVDTEYSDSLIVLDEGLLKFDGIKVRLLDSDRWRKSGYVAPADILLLCRGFIGDIKELLDVYPTECIVLDASLYKGSRERILRECAALGVKPVDLSVTGAVKAVADDYCFKMIPARDK